jgi:K+ transporter
VVFVLCSVVATASLCYRIRVAWMLRNAADAMGFFRLPTNRVVELGSQLRI